MNSHNTKLDFTYHKTPVVADTDAKEAELVSASLTNESGLQLDDDFDLGCDPYNATGQHVVIKSKNSPKE